jgi:hypothetical protein
MNNLIHFLKSLAIVNIIVGNSAFAAEVTLNYLTDFKIPMQGTYCMGKSSNGDLVTYKKCMLAIEKDVNKCDIETKPIYDHKFSNYNKDVTEFMDDIKPITEQYFTCLGTIY